MPLCGEMGSGGSISEGIHRKRCRGRAEANKTRGSEDAMTSLTVRYSGSTECAGAAGRTDASSHAVFHRLVNAVCIDRLVSFLLVARRLIREWRSRLFSIAQAIVTVRTSKTSWATEK